jgi:small subunit ribosomal protein S17
MAEDVQNADGVAETAPSSPPAAQRPQAEVLAPKERRASARAAKAAKVPAGKPRSPEERHAERLTERASKASARRAERASARAKAKAGASGATVAPTAPREHQVGVQKTRQGIVVSDKADKTITVRIDTARRHRRYEKIVRTSRKLHAHDERNDAHVGDTVIVREARPLSRTKRWRLVQVVERAK